MAITSLIIRIGAQDQEIEKALENVGKRTKSLDADISKLGNTPIGLAAQKSLEQMNAAMKSVTDAHQKLADRAVLTARGMAQMGGASKFTSDELAGLNRIAVKGVDAFRAMGQEAPPALAKMAEETRKVTAVGGGFTKFLSSANGLLGAFGIGLSVGAIVSFAKDITNAADALTKMHDKTGISVEGLQRMQIAGDDTGVSLESMTSAVNMLQKRLGGDDKSALAALRDMGISLAEFKSLDGAQQMLLLSKAVQVMTDPLRVAADLSALFGKSWADQLPALKRGFKEVEDGATVMSAGTTKALDNLGDAAGRLYRSFKANLGEALADILTLSLSATRREASELAATLDVITKRATAAAPKIKGLEAPELPKNLDAIEKALTKTATASIKAAENAKKAAEEHKRFAESVNSLTSSAIGATKAFGPYGALMQDLSGIALEHMARLDHLTSSMNEFHDGLTVAGDEMATVTIPMFAALPNVVAQATDKIRDATAAVEMLGGTLKGSVMESLGKIPDMLIRAFEGGGGIGGALKAIGVSLSQAILQPLMAKLSAVQKAAVSAGAGISSALGGAFGGGTGAAIAGIAGSLGGAALAASAWGTSMAAAGVAGTVALGAATLGIGAAAVGVYMLYKHFKSVEKQINPVREEFVRLNGGLAALNERAATAGVTLTAMLDAKNPKQYEAAINDLNDAFKFQNEAMQLLDETAQKYGLTLAEMGPKYAQGKLDEQFLVLLQDQKVLAAGGVNFDLILQKQATSFQELVNQAIKTGATIPAAMKPALERMLELGLLTDASGQKLTSLEGLTFSQTLEAQFSTLITTIDRLAQAISGTLGTAISHIPAPAPIHIPIQFDIPEMPRFAGGGIVQRFAKGGRVLPFVSRGTDTVPAMLTPGERVLTVQETHAYDAGASRSGMSTAALERKLDQLRQELAAQQRLLPKWIRDAVILAS
jgi:hypothetical protein